MSKRISKRARRQLVDLRMCERMYGKRGTSKIRGARNTTIADLFRRRLVRSISRRWEIIGAGDGESHVQVETFELTDHGRVVADQLVFGAKTSRSASDLLDDPDLAHYRVLVLGRKSWNRFHARTETHELRFRGKVGLRVWPVPAEKPRLEETWNKFSAAAAKQMIDEFYSAWPAYGLHAGFLGKKFNLIPSDREPLDKAINALDSGYSFTDDAHRRYKLLRQARAEHDAGDEDDGAIERGERQLRAQILGNGCLHTKPVSYPRILGIDSGMTSAQWIRFVRSPPGPYQIPRGIPLDAPAEKREDKDK